MLLLIGLMIGLLLGLTGAGGSVFAVPLLILISGMPMHEAVGISLGAVAATTLYGSLGKSLRKRILWVPGIILAASGALVAPLGKWIGMQVPELWLLLGFNLLAVVIALRMWLTATRTPEHAQVVRAGDFQHEPNPRLLCSMSRTGQFELRFRCMSGLLIGGLLVGLLSGLFGVGGGFLIVPLLLGLSSISMAQAVSTSLLIIAAVSSTGFVSYLFMHPQINEMALAWVALGGILGMLAGQKISHKIAGARLQKIFAASLITISVAALAIHL